MKRQELTAAGMSSGDARAAARRALGNVTIMKEDGRRVWIGRWLEILLQDSRYAGALAQQAGSVCLDSCLPRSAFSAYLLNSVEERRREIGVRRALGAARTHIVTLLLVAAGKGALLGLAAGLLVSAAGGVLLRQYLYGLSPLDPLAYVGVLVVLGLTAVAATFVPARRACRVDLAVTLREE